MKKILTILIIFLLATAGVFANETQNVNLSFNSNYCNIGYFNGITQDTFTGYLDIKNTLTLGFISSDKYFFTLTTDNSGTTNG